MAVAVFTASLIGKRLGVYGYVAIVLALLIGYSRIYIGVHYPLDVLFGFGVGAFLAFLFSSLYRRYFFTN
jgi:undecaprenyl-diphosphatase